MSANNDERLNEKVAGLSARIDNLEKKTEKLESNASLLYKLSTLTEQQIEFNRDIRQQAKDNQVIFKSIETNLNNLHNGQEKLSEKMEDMSERISKVEEKVSDLEEENENQTRAIEGKGTFNVLGFLSQEAPKLILVALLGAILISIGWQ